MKVFKGCCKWLSKCCVCWIGIDKGMRRWVIGWLGVRCDGMEGWVISGGREIRVWSGGKVCGSVK